MIKSDTLFFAIVNRGEANEVLKKATEMGALGGTIFLGEGTIQSKVLQALGITEKKKEILMISATYELGKRLHSELDELFSLSKRNKGILFSIPFRKITLQENGELLRTEERADKITDYCIMTIVDRGMARKCVKAARAKGARGGTIIHGHGAGIPTDFYFPLVIEPQKDIVMIITPPDKVDGIKDAIYDDMDLDQVGKGILFVLPVIETTGLVEQRSETNREVSV